MENAPEHHVYFAVFGFDEDPSVVTRMMGVQPTKVWVKGEPKAGSGRGKHTHSRWILQSTLPLSDPIEAHVENLLAQLECRQEAVGEVLSRFEARLAVAVYCYEVNPGFRLPADIIKRIATLRLDVDFDIYCLGGSGDPN